MTATRKQVMARAAELGATVNVDLSGGWPEVNVMAPAGHIWNDGDLIHEIVNAGYRGEPVANLYEAALERMQIGVIVCPLGKECEWCASMVTA